MHLHDSESLSLSPRRPMRPIGAPGDGSAWVAQLPTFHSRAALHQQAHWAAYLDRVYGIRAIQWPLNLSALGFFHGDVPMPAAVKEALPSLGRRTRGASNRSLQGEPAAKEALLGVRRSRRGIVSGRRWREPYRLYHPPYAVEATSTVFVYDDARAIPSHTKAEVFHCAETTRQTGFWMYAARGSGVWFDVGRTFSARNRCALWAALSVPLKLTLRGPRCVAFNRAWRNLSAADVPAGAGDSPFVNANAATTFAALNLPSRCPGFWCGSVGEMMHQQHMFTEAAMEVLMRRGYDSLQLTHTEEHGIFKFEIVDLRQHFRRDPNVATVWDASAHRLVSAVDEAPRACPHERASHFFSGGWAGLSSCHCNASRACINCASRAGKHKQAARAPSAR
jgi:hypothetical protein